MKRLKAVCLSALAVFFLMPCAFAEEAGDKADELIVVSLGDSYASGEGIEEFYGQELDAAQKVKNADWLAHRSVRSWAGALHFGGSELPMSSYKDGDGSIKWYFRASSGALVRNLSDMQLKSYDYPEGNRGKWGLPAQLDVFDTIPAGTVDYVTVSIGGNDVGFAELMGTALAGFNKALDRFIDGIWEKWPSIREDIRAGYESIAEKAGPQAQIIVVGYPTLLNDEGKEFDQNADYAFAIKAENCADVNRASLQLNREIEGIVQECADEGMNICFVDVTDAFRGHEAYTDDPYINGIYAGAAAGEDIDQSSKVSAYSFHPNEKGAAAYAKAVQAYIDSMGWN